MVDEMKNKRTDTASAVINAAPQVIYQAFLDPEAVAQWRPPGDMKCTIYEFEPREGGAFRIAFEYTSTDHPVTGKTSAHADVFHGRFLELVPNKRIVELIQFESDDPGFADEMKITTTLVPVPGGTAVSFIVENVPDSIRLEDHQLGMTSTLNNLAAFTAKG
jgi:uncharacterized protein YndB with AHSA1/START domain